MFWHRYRDLCVFAAIVGASLAHAAAAADRIVPASDPWAILSAQGFTGSLDFTRRDDSETSIGLIGTIATGGRRYDIFFHSVYWNKQEGVFIRGGHRLVVIRDRCCYVGSYSVPPDLPVVTGRRIEFPIDDGGGAVIEFTEAGPPPSVRLVGEVKELFR